jgi:hypothetical protein
MALCATVTGWPVVLVLTGLLTVERHYQPRPCRLLAGAYGIVGIWLAVVALGALAVGGLPPATNHH